MAIVANRIRLGILALPVAGMLILVGDLLLPAFGTLSGGAEYARMVVSTKYQIVSGLYALGDTLYLFGIFALYAFLAGGPGERWGLAGLVVTVVWLVSYVTYYGTIASVEPALGHRYLEGHEDAFKTTVYNSAGHFNHAMFFVSVWFGYAGLALLGVGIWRSGPLPRGAVILGLAFVALNPIAYAVSNNLGLVGDLLLTGASGWIAWVVWRRRSPAKARQRVRRPASTR